MKNQIETIHYIQWPDPYDPSSVASDQMIDHWNRIFSKLEGGFYRLAIRQLTKSGGALGTDIEKTTRNRKKVRKTGKKAHQKGTSKRRK